MATIVTKNSSTASAVPTTSDLVQGELAVNVTDKRIFTENASTQIVELGTNPSTVTTGTATVTGTLTANGTFASNNAVITGGSINSTPIGATTASTGNFSVLSISGTAITATATEINLLDGVTATAAEINTLDGITATTTELNYTDGVTSNIQTQLNTKASLASPTFTGTVTADGLSLGDNDKAIFGNSNDLQIYHDGSHSRILHPAASGGDFYIQADDLYLTNAVGNNYVKAISGGAVTLAYSNSDKLATTATGIDVTGTVTANDIYVGDTTPSIIIEDTDGATTGFITATGSSVQFGSSTSEAVQFYTNNTLRQNISSNGNIVFYEDTGTTPKFYWDASAESLGIGTSSPSQLLELSGATAPAIRLNDTTYNQYAEISTANAGSLILKADVSNGGTGFTYIGFEVDGANEAMRIDSAGNVGIGTNSPSAVIHVNGSSQGDVYFRGETGATKGLLFSTFNVNATDHAGHNINAVSSVGEISFSTGSTEAMRIDSSGNVGIGTTSPLSPIHVEMASSIFRVDNTTANFTDLNSGSTLNGFIFRNGSTETMRIDASGNLLVGKTANNVTTAGVNLNSNGYVSSSVSGNPAAYFNRATSDGNIAIFLKNGTTVGSIGTSGGALQVSGNTNSGLQFNSSAFVPMQNGATIDATIDLGSSVRRFKDLYLSGTVTAGGVSIDDDNNYSFGDGTTYIQGSGAADRLKFITNATERMRIDSTGNIGIGTSSPTAVGNYKVLQIRGNATTNGGMIRLETSNGTSGVARFFAGSGSTVLESNSNTPLTFGTNAITRMTIDTLGKVGIGTSSPSRILHVENNGLADLLLRDTSTYSVGTGPAVIFQGNDSGSTITQFGAIYGVSNGSNSGQLTFETRNSGSSAERMRIDSSGNIGIGTSSPAYTLDVNGDARFYDASGSSSNYYFESDHYCQVNITSDKDASAGGPYNTAITANGSNGNLELRTNNLQRVSIDQSGNVGIGNTSPASLLHLNSASDPVLRLQRGGGVYSQFQSDSAGSLYLSADAGNTGASSRMQFNVDGSESMRIAASGNIGIGTSTPFAKLVISEGGVQGLEIDAWEGGDTVRLMGLNRSTLQRIPVTIDASEVIFQADVSTERMRIDSAGNVGIGTTSPSSYNAVADNLVIGTTSGSNGLTIVAGTSNDGSIHFADGTTGADAYRGQIYYSHAGNYMVFGTNATESMRIDSSGNLLVGATSAMNVSTNGHYLRAYDGGYAYHDMGHPNATASGAYYNIFRYNTSIIGTVTQNGTSGVSYNTTSDYRLKENVVALTGATNRLKQLKPSRFNFIADSDITVDGFLAHEVQDVVPEAIAGTKDAVDEDGNPVYQGIDQSKLVPLLVATIKELEARISTLEGN